MKIKIVYPAMLDREDHPIHTKARDGKTCNLTMLLLAGLTPPEHEVEVVDELFEPLDFDEPVDLVALTAMTCQAPRAYQIAQAYRERGVKTVMGGFHATFNPAEATGRVDAVVTGEGETAWPEVLADAEAGRLQPVYQGRPLPSLADLPSPRYDLLAGKRQRYQYLPVWVGRGCPHNCNYCSVTRFYGPRIRNRTVDRVIRDIAGLPGKRFLFMDDNLFAQKDLIRDLLREMAPLRAQWFGQLDVGMAANEELMDLAREAGMETAFIGFESYLESDLDLLNKSWSRQQDFKEVIKGLHRRGILVHALMIFGIRPESPSTVAETLRQLEQWKVDELSLFFLIPTPGSRLRSDLEERGMDLSRDWARYNGNNSVMVPAGTTAEEQEQLYWSLYQSFYSPGSTARRFFRIPFRPYTFALSIARNLVVYHNDVHDHRPAMNNFFDPRELIPGYSARLQASTDHR